MKAARFSRFGTPDVLEIVDLPDPHAGPGQVRASVRAAGINASDWKKRQGLMDQELPQTMGYEVAGVVDELGAGVTDVAIGDAVFGFAADGAAQAERAVLSNYAPMPAALDFAHAAALPAAVETATRVLDQLGVNSGCTLLIHGAAGNIGRTALQLALARGAHVIGTGRSPASQALIMSLGAESVASGEGLAERVRTYSPTGVDYALDAAGGGALPDLIELAGSPEHVITIADAENAQRYGVRFSRGDAGRAMSALGQIADLLKSGQLSVPVVRTFRLAEVADAHRAGESGAARAKLVLLIGSPTDETSGRDEL